MKTIQNKVLSRITQEATTSTTATNLIHHHNYDDSKSIGSSNNSINFVTLIGSTTTNNNNNNDSLIDNSGNSCSDNCGDQIRSNNKLDFSWLNSYIREDCIAIDRKIADGSKPLKKGESKFQDELKKHEHKYIVYKKYK